MGSLKVLDVLEAEIKRCREDIEIITTGCQGLCQKGPLMKIEPYGYFYQRIGTSYVPKIVEYTLSAGFPVRELFYRDSIITTPIETMEEVPFYKKQKRLVLRNNEKIDPENIYHYIANDGYLALEKALFSLSPLMVIEEIKKSGLRGRGGAGFPTGIKWEVVKNSPNKTKIVVANGDEGDPGAFMDRSIMEGDPHSLLEGMLLCAYAIGARYGFIYVRHEYPLAVKNLTIALKQSKELGLIGENILGAGFSFDISIREGAGAFVCGEETALLASIEGRRGFPSQRPPFPAEEGIWSYPTCINNIETFANVPYIIANGSENFAKMGTERSKGTKVFALAGKIKNTGLIEVPMGITLKEIIYDIGGGILHDKKLKAVQTGGPSGGCIPAELMDIQVDFDSLFDVGSMMGSGGMVVMDEDDCMVDVAKYFLSFCQSESCGKCPPCRIGTYQMLQILEKITSGNGEEGDIEKLEKLGRLVKEGSLCGLGGTAPNPVLTTIRYFREEYEEHIHDKYCRAKVCTLGEYKIDTDECFLCGLCKEACAFDAVKETRRNFFIDMDCCTKCKACYIACPIGVVKIEKAESTQKVAIQKREQ
jgi:NADH:ubiquinone oxidoreductase subunit F (NADH-binding)/(2Fe-2S) ferredoxin/NAD-dependent dihydropyrimidine dehydrogenase PreA subunit